MKYVALLDTAILTFNQGDNIIMESIKRELEYILKDKFVINIPTHSPAFKEYEIMKIPFHNNPLFNNIDKCNPKFVCGTNLLENNMFRRQTTWDIKLNEAKYIKNCVLVGVGAGKYGKFNYYTKKLLKTVLSKDYIHSVRDNEAKQMLEELGLKAINTGCPTLWNLTKNKCTLIKKQKSDKVVFTLTDYKEDKKQDQKMIDILQKNYKEIYFWVQGINDFNYFQSFRNIENIKIISPSVSEYQKFLNKNECDFVRNKITCRN